MNERSGAGEYATNKIDVTIDRAATPAITTHRRIRGVTARSMATPFPRCRTSSPGHRYGATPPLPRVIVGDAVQGVIRATPVARRRPGASIRADAPRMPGLP